MNTLLDIASHDQSDSSSLQPSCVHALNILRAVFRESRLGDHVMPYVASGFKAALYGISSHVWAVSTALTMLKIMVGHSFKIGDYHWLPRWKSTVNLSYQIGLCSVYTKVGWKMTCDRPLF